MPMFGFLKDLFPGGQQPNFAGATPNLGGMSPQGPPPQGPPAGVDVTPSMVAPSGPAQVPQQPQGLFAGMPKPQFGGSNFRAAARAAGGYGAPPGGQQGPPQAPLQNIQLPQLGQRMNPMQFL